MALVKSDGRNGHPYSGSTIKHVRKMLNIYDKPLDTLDPNKVRTIRKMTSLTRLMPKIERWFQHPKARKVSINQGPIFVIGYARSGTTHFHRLLTQDPQFGYLKGIQALCPEYFLSQGSISKYFYKKKWPAHRPVDRVKLSWDAPQEDEFAIANMTHMSPFHGMYLPSLRDYFFYTYLRIADLPTSMKEEWVSRYELLLTKLSYYWSGKTLVLKNPLHTARIAFLKNCFPKAKFIYLLRHPESVFPSVSKFLGGLLPTIMLEKEWFDENEFRNRDHYLKVMEKVDNEVGTLQSQDFIGIQYDDLIQNPLDVLRTIYSKLDLSHFDERNFLTYLRNQQQHKVQKHIVDQELKDHLGKEVYDLYQRHLNLCTRID